MRDVIVVGARAAGAATAMLLAREGHDVLLVDRARFPSDIPHGHFIHRGGPGRLARWGVLDRVLAAGARPVTAMTLHAGDAPLTGTALEVDGVPFGIGPRRANFDQVLVDAAVEAGAEFRDGFAVQGLLTDGGTVTGVLGRDARTGATVREHATLTIGADGRNSAVARSVGATVTLSEPAVTCWYWSYWSGVDQPTLEIHVRGRLVVFTFPTDGGLTAVFVAWPLEQLPRVKRDVAGAFAEALTHVPELEARLADGERAERFYGATQLPNFLRRPHGQGWALVGDAGMHKDPFQALGMCDALRDAEGLATAAHAGLTGETPMAEALGRYERDRDEATTADFWANYHAACFRPPPAEQQAVRRALLQAGDEDRRAFYLEMQRLAPEASFLNGPNLARLAEA